MRKQKVHNKRVRSTTPIFLPFRGPDAAFRSAQYSHRCCGVFLVHKRGFPAGFAAKYGASVRLKLFPLLPSWLARVLLANEATSAQLSHIVLQQLVSFRQEEAAPPLLLPPPPSPPPAPMVAVVGVILCSRAKDQVTALPIRLNMKQTLHKRTEALR